MNINPNANRPNVADLASIVIATFALVALAWMAGSKISALHLNIVTADSLYLPLIYDNGFANGRFASSNFLFPDFLYYAAMHAAGVDVADAVVVAGVIQCAISTMLIARYCGIVPALLYNFLYYYLGTNYHFLIGYHQGVILMSLLYLRFQNITARRAMSLMFTLADPLFALLAAVSIWVEASYERVFDSWKMLCIFLGYFAAFYMCESSIELIRLAPIVLTVLLAGWTSTLDGPRKVFLALQRKAFAATGRSLSQSRACGLLLACAVIGGAVLGQPTRYLVPVMVCALIFFSWRTGAAPQARRLWISASMIGAACFVSLHVLVKPALQFEAKTSVARYACLSDTLRSRQINSIATDYWTAKPLYFFAGENNDLAILQLNFREGIPNSWAVDRRFVRGQTGYIVKNTARCQSVDPFDRDTPGNCSDEWFTSNLGVKARTEVCGGFEIIETNRPVDFSRWADAFRSKPAAFVYNLRRNVGKFMTRLHAGLNAR